MAVAPFSLFKKIIKFLIPRIWIVRIRALKAPQCQKGRDVYIAPSAQLLGAANIAVGNNSCISEQAWLNVNHRHKGEIAIHIGDNCFIGRQNFFSSGKKIEIGHYVLTTIDCKFICSSHVINNPLLPYIATGTTDNDVIRVGTNCFFGAGAMVIGNVDIGHGSVIGAGAQVTKDVPPFSIVVGMPAQVAKRYSFSRKAWLAADVITEDDLLDNPGEEAYLSQLRSQYPDISMPLIAASTHLGNL